MLEQIRKFRVTALTVQGFKGHKDPVTYQFGDLNEITGHMGVGKSSIADAIAFAITGVTFFGSSKLDSLYHNGQRDLLVDMSFDGDDERRIVLFAAGSMTIWTSSWMSEKSRSAT